ncbi:sulfatase-like hydrolase/transferase [Aestuariibacter sp. A3R04]|uniref:sulfatase-like hydrolase/transferase n=1 Tax=Aestuariibacter sp. A3R04 TaxID=2841571 RepID=UPI001C087556|nr:sulfatase-like hydrolase/transferase [Aestuariibacter sp. A3R04]MBU3020247.1 sulfatase-like hydrolase/transferase [Aestuariibacter sp. A3R04]
MKICVLLTLVLLGFSVQLRAEGHVQKKPNIIVFVTDDEGFHHISRYGADVQTPAIDELAEKGVTFTQAIAPAAVCTPSRYSIMTGLYAGKNKSNTFIYLSGTHQFYQTRCSCRLFSNKYSRSFYSLFFSAVKRNSRVFGV